MSRLYFGLACCWLVVVCSYGRRLDELLQASCVCPESCPDQAMLESIAGKMAALTDHVERQTKQLATLQHAIEKLAPPVDGRPDSTSSADDGSGDDTDIHKGAFLGGVNSACPEDYVYNNETNMCFKLYAARRTRAGANSFCRRREPGGARLIVLDTEAKHRVLKQHLLLHHDLNGWGDQIWLGGMQGDDEGQWYWTTGQEMTANWAPGEPNDEFGNEDCVVLTNVSEWPSWVMNDVPCGFEFRFVCEHLLGLADS